MTAARKSREDVGVRLAALARARRSPFSPATELQPPSRRRRALTATRDRLQSLRRGPSCPMPPAQAQAPAPAQAGGAGGEDAGAEGAAGAGVIAGGTDPRGQLQAQSPPARLTPAASAARTAAEKVVALSNRIRAKAFAADHRRPTLTAATPLEPRSSASPAGSSPAQLVEFSIPF